MNEIVVITIVEFVVAKDKRDGMMRRTQISFLEQSFLKSKEHREIVDAIFCKIIKKKRKKEDLYYFLKTKYSYEKIG